jgi:predicted MPP superfamily phosphohydrolase
MKKKRRILIKVLSVIVILAVITTVYLIYNGNKNKSFITTFYSMTTDENISNLRIVQISDLHLEEFGENNSELVKKVKDLSPDLIAITGDMNIDTSGEYSVVTDLLNNLTPIAPVYYTPGNHEWTGAYNNGHKDMIEAIRNTDAVYMENKYKNVTINGNTLTIGCVFGYGEKILSEDWSKNMLDNFSKEEGFKLLLCHFPEVFADVLSDYSFDLVLCGHAHGGQVRLPFTDGLWCENQGFLPKYTSGLKKINNSMVCISRGLGNKNHVLPRINNQPELVVIDVN